MAPPWRGGPPKKGKPGAPREARRHEKTRHGTFVKTDYLFIVNGMVLETVLGASSRFSIKTGGCGR
jgi:hypothetical protein